LICVILCNFIMSSLVMSACPVLYIAADATDATLDDGDLDYELSSYAEELVDYTDEEEKKRQASSEENKVNMMMMMTSRVVVKDSY